VLDNFEDDGPFKLLVHGKIEATFDTRDEVNAVKESYRHRFPNLHIAIRDKYGISTELADFR